MRISDWSSDVCSSDLSAVQRHAAVPELEDLDRMAEVIAEIVEEDIADAPADDDAEHRIEDHVVGVAARHRGAGLRDQLQQIPVTDEDSRSIGKRIPADGQAEDAERDFAMRSEEHTSELQSLMRISYAVFCLKKKKARKHRNGRLK